MSIYTTRLLQRIENLEKIRRGVMCKWCDRDRVGIIGHVKRYGRKEYEVIKQEINERDITGLMIGGLSAMSGRKDMW